MGWFAKAVGEAGGAAVGTVVKDAGSALGTLAKDLRAAITGDVVISEEGRIRLEELAIKLEEVEQSLALGQVEINKLEAQNPSLFVSGWRPFIGWVLGVSLASYFLPKHLLAAVFWIKACWSAGVVQAYPIDAQGLIELVGAMLGLGTLRSIEKWGGVARLK